MFGGEGCQCVEQLTHAIVAEGGSEEDGEDGTLCDELCIGGGGDRARLEVFIERRLVCGSGVFKSRGIPRREGGAVEAGRGKACAKIGHKRAAPGVFKIAFVHEDERGDLVAPEQVPERLGVALDAVVGAHDEERTVESGDGALCFCGKIHVPGRVEKHDMGAVPVKRGL